MTYLPKPHFIARCIWQTAIDDKESAYQLQEDLSCWTSSELPKILNNILDKYFPPNQTWQINRLELNLGKIDYTDLLSELPFRVAEALKKALIHHRIKWSPEEEQLSETLAEDKEQAVTIPKDLNQRYSDFICWYLQHGTSPWWYKGSQSHRSIFIEQLQKTPKDLLYTLQNLGRQENVRKRIVWQYGEETTRKIISLLEPNYDQYIFDFVDNLFEIQAEEQLPECDESLFHKHTWLWVLTHLLVERGSLFNTVDFVKSTLRQMAHHYALDYESLIVQISKAAETLQLSGHRIPQFIQAMKIIQQQEQEKVPCSKTKVDYWQLLNNALTDNAAAKVNGQTYTLDALFVSLLQEDPERMRDLLKIKGKDEKVRARLIQSFTEKELLLTVELLEPQHHIFITAYISTTTEVLTKEKSDKNIIWEVILSYLLVDSGSYFNRRQFMAQTLRKISHENDLDYFQLLSMLTDNLAFSQSCNRLEALVILNDLREEEQQNQTRPVDRFSLYQEAFEMYLLSGRSPKALQSIYLPPVGIIFIALLAQRPQLLADSIAKVLNEKKSLDFITLQLIKVTKPRDFIALIKMLNPKAAIFFTRFTELFTHSTVISTILSVSSISHLQEKMLIIILRYINKNISASDLINEINKEFDLGLTPELVSSLKNSQSSTAFQELEEFFKKKLEDKQNSIKSTSTDELKTLKDFIQDGDYLNHADFEEIFKHLLIYGRVPATVSHTSINIQKIIKDLLESNPQRFLSLITGLIDNRDALFRLINLLKFDQLIAAVQHTSALSSNQTRELRLLYSGLSKLNLPGITKEQLQELLLDKTLRSIIQTLSGKSVTSSILSEVKVDLIGTYQIPVKTLEKEIAEYKDLFPEPNEEKITKEKSEAMPTPVHEQEEIMEVPIPVNNAGLVLLQGFFTPYFHRLNLLEDKGFTSPEKQRQAVHFLQYLVTGQSSTEEQHLALNKLLCGLPLNAPVEYGIDMTSEQEKTAKGLIEAVINYWNAIGSSSVDGFRGNWLLRNGILKEGPDNWELIIEKMAYDILLEKAPFAYSVIHFSWMPKPLYVTWPT